MIGAVFCALIGVWGLMLWTTPEREVQAAAIPVNIADAPFTSADPAPQVTIPYDSLRQKGTPAGTLRDTSARSILPQQAPADTAKKYFPPAVDTTRKPVAPATDTTVRQPAARPVVPGALPDSSAHHAPADTSKGGRLSDTLRVTLTKADSARIDSLKKVPPRDSTARVAQFLYKRPAPISALPVAPRGYAMFLKQPTLVQTEVRIDSTGRYVIIRETVGGKDVKLPVRMPLDAYVALRFKEGITRNFDELVLKSADSKKRDDLGELLTSFTNIDIPIPANPVFSIFGPPRINLHISGAVDIRAAFKNTTTDQVTASALGNSRNEPDFSQEVQINVSGTIGDKLNINADWNTQRQFEYENQLKIKYTGYEDEIVQSVEAGNVSLPTNSRFISSSSALFGIKAQFQLGPLKLTAVASQKKGQIQEKSINGGSSDVTFQKKAYEYSKNHFFLDTLYRQYYEQYINARTVNSTTQVKDFEVWMTNTSSDLTGTRQGIAYIDLPATNGDPTTSEIKSRRDLHGATPTPGEIEEGRWVRLDPDKDYRIDQAGGFITLNRATEGLAVALAYRVEGLTASPNDDQFYGTLTSKETPADSVLVFKLIKPKNLLPSNKVAWLMMMKNYYPLGGTKIQKAGFTLDMVYRGNTGDPTPKIEATNIIQLFGLDNYSDDGTPNPDGKFDYLPGTTIDEEHGEIIFPTLEPFRSGLIKAFQKYHISVPADSFIYPEVYDTTTFAAQNNSVRDKFTITGKTTAGSSNTISLGFNIVENSVQVLLNGQALTPNVDYTVDYIIGQVIIKNQAALVPGANLQVKFEQNDLFQLASKTLMGLRGDVNVSDRTQFGFTMMSLNQQTLSDKVRLGEEPMKNSIYGIDGKTGADLPLLTKALDALPILSTKEKSDISIFGEAAYMSPDPNTKKSPIPIDDGKSIAYLDDFEGAKRTIPLGVGYGLWHDASAPAYQLNVDTDRNNLIPDNEKINSKGRAYWYNILPSDVKIDQIYGDKKTVPKGQEQLTVLNLNYNPRQRGEYNYSMNLKNHFGASASVDSVRRNWAGVQRVLSSSALDLVRENVNFIELWVKVDSGRVDTTNKIFIDLGAISEDVIPNGKLDTEEKGVPNGILNEGEDTGIDGWTDAEERANKADFLLANRADFPELDADPSGDNWSLNINAYDYKNANGTENNAASEIGKFPDTEDLNHNNVLDRTNSYFEYELNLDTSATNPQCVGGGLNGWYQYRIPLIDAKDSVGRPDLSLIEFVRMWMTGFDKSVQLRIYDFNLVGNQWEEMIKNDSTFVVSTINVEDNLNYVSPPGVIREQDKTQTDAVVYGNEQSLQLKVKDLRDGEMRHAIKRFTYKALDVFNYKKMRMFMHGDQSWSNDPNKPTANVVVRFGIDTLNFYEYKAQIFPGMDKERPSAADAPLVWPSTDNIDIDFQSLTAIKQGRDSSRIDRTTGIYRPTPNSPYGVRGNPDLSRVAFISIGVENPPGNEPAVTGDVWINELRLIDVDNTPGWAYAVSANLKLADLATVGFTYSKQDPFFHQLETAFGSRTTSVAWNLTTSVSLEKFLPSSWAGTSFPFTYSHSEGYSAPKYLPASDVEVDKAAEQQRENVLRAGGSSKDADYEYKRLIFETQSIRISDSYSLPSFRLSMPYDDWFVQDIINKMQFGFTYNTSFERVPSKEYSKAWNWQATFGYAYTFSPDLFFLPFELFTDVPIVNGLKDVKVFFPITNFSLKLATSRSQIKELIRNQLLQNPTQRNFTASRGFAFGWKLTENGLLNLSGDYSVDIASTLVHLETDSAGRQRGFYKILSSLFMRDQLMGFGIDNSYMQNLNINSRPRVPNLFDINKFLTLSARYGVGYSWANNLTLGELGKTTRWSSNISLGSDLSLKQFVETWWPAAKKSEPTQSESQSSPGTGRRRNRVEGPGTDNAPSQQPVMTAADSAAEAAPVKDTSRTRIALGQKLLNIARIAIKTPLLDYDKINMSFTETNSSTNTGVPGRPGFANFFGRLPFIQDGVLSYGPTWAYQMGLVSDPTANVTDIHLQSRFPFFGFITDDNMGRRAARLPVNSTLPEAFTQSNKLSFKTNRDLWEGARVDLNWTVGWDYSRTQNLHIDLDPITGKHIATISGLTTGGSIERSFFTLPPVLIFSSLKSGIAEVGKQYNIMQADSSDKRSDDQKLSDAFEKGFETLPILRKIFGSFMPRMNYTFHWDGLEKYSMFTSWATRVSLDHAYQSTFRSSFRSDPSGNQVTESERVMYGFAPLLGMSITFKELMKGNMSANVRYSTTGSYDLSPAAKNIAETGSREISVTATYGRTGFEIPFFGLALNNDIDLSLSYSYAKNSRTTYSTTGDKFDATGTPGEGSSRTTMEPRIKYVLSQRVTASLFYRYTKIAPDAGGSRIPGSTTNEGGLDVHIAIQ
jgi:cell surface protein SprA